MKSKYFFVEVIFLYFFLFLFGLSCNSQNSSHKNLVKENDSTYVALSYYPDGSLEARAYFDSQKILHGKFEFWFMGGAKNLKYNYYHGEKHGKQLAWWKNGNLSREENYKLGKLHGVKIGWWEDGEKTHEEEYRDGILIRKVDFKNDYVNPTMLKLLLEQGIDSTAAIDILKNNRSGKIIKSDSGKSKVKIDN